MDNYEKRAKKMPPWAIERFGPEWKKYLEEYFEQEKNGETPYFRGSEDGSLPTPFALWALGFSEEEIQKVHPATRHSFVTVRLDNNTPLTEVQHKIQTINFAWLKVGSARLELFSSDLTRNHHIHMLVPWTVKTRIIRDLASYFKVPRPNVDVKHSDNTDLYHKRQDYINGEKQDAKNEAIQADSKELYELDIQQVYLIENL